MHFTNMRTYKMGTGTRRHFVFMSRESVRGVINIWYATIHCKGMEAGWAALSGDYLSTISLWNIIVPVLSSILFYIISIVHVINLITTSCYLVFSFLFCFVLFCFCLFVCLFFSHTGRYYLSTYVSQVSSILFRTSRPSKFHFGLAG